MNSRFKIFVALLLLFGAGVGTGIFISPHLKPEHPTRAFPVAEWTDSTLAEYRARLDLDAREEEQARSAITKAALGIVRERSEAQQRLQAVIKTMNSDILAQLDAGSQARLQKLLEEKREKMAAGTGP